VTCWRWQHRWPNFPRYDLRCPTFLLNDCNYCTPSATSWPTCACAFSPRLEDDPPLTLADGGVIRSGVDATLDELRDLSRNSKQYIAQIEQRERQRTGIGSLKVKFNSVFGYYLEISKANLHLAPADYERKQTLVNAERFTTPELKEYEAKVLDAQEKMVEIERRLFAELRSAIAAEARRIRQTALALAEIDLLAAFASLPPIATIAGRGWTIVLISRSSRAVIPSSSRWRSQASPIASCPTIFI
jgi:DNA mismatch repair ATPase MutS